MEMLTPQEQEKLQMATICGECRWGIFHREEHDGLIVRMETPLCGHQSSLIGRNFVTGEFLFKRCEIVNQIGNCPIFEPKVHPNQENVIAHDGVSFDESEDEGPDEDDD
jgi:hypothetical protein